MADIALITGAGRALGARVAVSLGSDESFERIIGVDTIAPDADVRARFGRTEFVRADIREPLIGTVIDQARVTTVVHTDGPSAIDAGVRGHGLLGSRQLIDGVRRTASVQRLIAVSSTAVYGAGRRDPSVFTEAHPPAGDLAPGPGRAAAELEAQIRGLGRDRRDIVSVVFRLAPLIGRTFDTWLTRYLTLPAVPTDLGFDPPLQVLHEDDAVAVLVAATTESTHARSAVLNAAGAGGVPLSQVLRWGARARVPLPAPALALAVEAGRRRAGVAEVGDLARAGRIVDCSALAGRFGPIIEHSSAATLREFLARHPAPPGPIGLAVALTAFAERILLAGTDAQRSEPSGGTT